MTNWLNEHGQPFADYEVRAIEEPNCYTEGDAVGYLGFQVWGDEAVACDTCGALFTRVIRHLHSQRRICGWPNGSAAVADA